MDQKTTAKTHRKKEQGKRKEVPDAGIIRSFLPHISNAPMTIAANANKYDNNAVISITKNPKWSF